MMCLLMLERRSLLQFLKNAMTLAKLKIELAVTVDGMDPFVRGPTL